MPYKINAFTGKLDYYEAGAEDYYLYKSGSVQHFMGAGKQYSVYEQQLAHNFVAYPIEIKSEVSIEDLRLYIQATSVGNSVIGVYKVENGEPTSLEFQTTQYDNNVGGLQLYVPAQPKVLLKGLYVVALHTSSVVSFKSVTWEQTLDFMGIAPNLNFTDNFFPRYYGSIAYSSTMPASFPVAAIPYNGNIAIPLIGFKII